MTTSKLDGDLAGRITCPKRRRAGRSAAWLARLPWEQEVTSSNLVAPILGPRGSVRRAGPRDRPGDSAIESSGPMRRLNVPTHTDSPKDRAARGRGDSGPGWDDRRPRIGLDGRADGPASRRPRRAEGLNITGVATSVATAELARSLKIPLRELDEVEALDINLDGADEIDPQFRMIKGRGGALLREKIVALRVRSPRDDDHRG